MLLLIWREPHKNNLSGADVTVATLKPTTVSDPTGPFRLHLVRENVSALGQLSKSQVPSMVHRGTSLGGPDGLTVELAETTHAHSTASDQEVPVRADAFGSLPSNRTDAPSLVSNRDGASTDTALPRPGGPP